MSMVNLLVWCEFASLNIKPHFAICVTERHTLSGKPVNLLHTEYIVILAV